MKKILTGVPALLMLALPLIASAHEHGTYMINGVPYQIVIGSLNEPVAVDDKTGVDLTVSKCNTSACAATMGPDGDMDGPAGPGVTGLDQTLKVTLKARSQSKTLSLAPGDSDGKYTAEFYPTVATTISYELTGTINNTPVDLTYTCAPAGSSMSTENNAAVKLSDKVTQTSIAGAFGCPIEKTNLGFPQPSASIASLASAGNADMTWWGIGLGALGSVLGLAALSRKRS